MLVLERHATEGVYVDGPCRIVVVAITRRAVKLGFEAPETTRIVRDEAKARTEKPK